MPLTPREYLRKRRRLQKRYEDLGYALETLEEDALGIPEPNLKSISPVVNPQPSPTTAPKSPSERL